MKMRWLGFGSSLSKEDKDHALAEEYAGPSKNPILASARTSPESASAAGRDHSINAEGAAREKATDSISRLDSDLANQDTKGNHVMYKVRQVNNSPDTVKVTQEAVMTASKIANPCNDSRTAQINFDVFLNDLTGEMDNEGDSEHRSRIDALVKALVEDIAKTVKMDGVQQIKLVMKAGGVTPDIETVNFTSQPEIAAEWTHCIESVLSEDTGLGMEMSLDDYIIFRAKNIVDAAASLKSKITEVKVNDSGYIDQELEKAKASSAAIRLQRAEMARLQAIALQEKLEQEKRGIEIEALVREAELERQQERSQLDEAREPVEQVDRGAPGLGKSSSSLFADLVYSYLDEVEGRHLSEQLMPLSMEYSHSTNSKARRNGELALLRSNSLEQFVEEQTGRTRARRQLIKKNMKMENVSRKGRPPRPVIVTKSQRGALKRAAFRRPRTPADDKSGDESIDNTSSGSGHSEIDSEPSFLRDDDFYSIEDGLADFPLFRWFSGELSLQKGKKAIAP